MIGAGAGCRPFDALDALPDVDQDRLEQPDLIGVGLGSRLELRVRRFAQPLQSLETELCDRVCFVEPNLILSNFD